MACSELNKMFDTVLKSSFQCIEKYKTSYLHKYNEFEVILYLVA